MGLSDTSALPLHVAVPQVVKLKAFSKFEDTTSALAAATALCEGKLDKGQEVHPHTEGWRQAIADIRTD